MAAARLNCRSPDTTARCLGILEANAARLKCDDFRVWRRENPFARLFSTGVYDGDMRVILLESDPQWPTRFDEEKRRIAAALEGVAADLLLEHIGSTSVPGLAAKPVIDVMVGVPDLQAFDRDGGTAAMAAAGYDYLQSFEATAPFRRLFTREAGDTRLSNVHLVQADHPWVRRHLTFREYLREVPAARQRYEAEKRRLAALDWPTVNDYAGAKTPVVIELEEEAFTWRGLPEAERHLLRTSRI